MSFRSTLAKPSVIPTARRPASATANNSASVDGVDVAREEASPAAEGRCVRELAGGGQVPHPPALGQQLDRDVVGKGCHRWPDRPGTPRREGRPPAAPNLVRSSESCRSVVSPGGRHAAGAAARLDDHRIRDLTGQLLDRPGVFLLARSRRRRLPDGRAGQAGVVQGLPLQELVRQPVGRQHRVVGEREPLGDGRGERHLGLCEREDAAGSMGGDRGRDRVGVESGPVDDLTETPQQSHHRAHDRIAAVNHPDDPAETARRLGEHHRSDRHDVVHDHDSGKCVPFLCADLRCHVAHVSSRRPAGISG